MEDENENDNDISKWFVIGVSLRLKVSCWMSEFDKIEE